MIITSGCHDLISIMVEKIPIGLSLFDENVWRRNFHRHIVKRLEKRVKYSMQCMLRERKGQKRWVRLIQSRFIER